MYYVGLFYMDYGNTSSRVGEGPRRASKVLDERLRELHSRPHIANEDI
jgi:hypothetical protein